MVDDERAVVASVFTVTVFLFGETAGVAAAVSTGLLFLVLRYGLALGGRLRRRRRERRSG